jgi:hypothetical protein
MNGLMDLKKLISESNWLYTIHGVKYDVSTFNKDTFVNHLNVLASAYKKKISILEFVEAYGILVSEIERLNEVNKKRQIYNKAAFVRSVMYSRYRSSIDANDKKYFQYKYDLIKQAVSFLEKVKSLYAVDTDELEKKLKGLDSPDEIYKLIMSE